MAAVTALITARTPRARGERVARGIGVVVVVVRLDSRSRKPWRPLLERRFQLPDTFLTTATAATVSIVGLSIIVSIGLRLPGNRVRLHRLFFARSHQLVLQRQ